MIEGKYTENFMFYPKWMQLSDEYELKVLIMTSFLTESDGKCRQTLANMCRWLDVKPNSYTRSKIKVTLEKLSDEGYLTYSNTGNNWIIELLFEKGWGMFSFKRKWLDQIRKANHDESGKLLDPKLSISWVKVVKVFVHAHVVLQDREVRMIPDCAKELNMSAECFSKAYKIFKMIEFDDVSLEKKTHHTIKERVNGIPISFRTDGTQFFIDSLRAADYGSTYSPYLNKLRQENSELVEELYF